MITITNRNDIEAALENFKPDKQGAYSTDRCLPGQYEQANCQEWAERGTINGTPAKIYYMFDRNEDDLDCEADRLPWDADHITKIDVAEADEDGDFEQL